MKKVLLTIISVCLIAASIFGLFAGVSSFSDIMNVKEYKEEDAKEGLEAIETLNDGLDQLQENEGTYLAGVDTYTAGLIENGQGWVELLNARNLTSHIYDEETAQRVFAMIQNDFLPLFRQLADALELE